MTQTHGCPLPIQFPVDTSDNDTSDNLFRRVNIFLLYQAELLFLSRVLPFDGALAAKGCNRLWKCEHVF